MVEEGEECESRGLKAIVILNLNRKLKLNYNRNRNRNRNPYLYALDKFVDFDMAALVLIPIVEKGYLFL